MSWEEQEFPFPTPLRMSGPETTMMANNTQCICMMVTLSVVTDIELVGRRLSESINNASSVVQESLSTCIFIIMLEVYIHTVNII